MDIPIDFAIYERCHEQNAPRNFKVEKMSKVCRRDVETVPGKTTPSKPPEKVFGAAGVYFFGFSDVDIMPTCHIGNCKSGQITIIPKPECFGHFGGILLLNHQFGVTTRREQVAIICSLKGTRESPIPETKHRSPEEVTKPGCLIGSYAFVQIDH